MDLIKNSMKNILRKKMRSMLTIIGISIGVLSVIIISIIGEVGKATVNSELNSMGISGFCIRTSGNSGEETKSLSKEELAMVQANPEVEEASPLVTKISSIRAAAAVSQAVVWGIDSNAPNIVSMELIHGRYINRKDVSSNAKVCIVDESFAKMTYKRSNIVGKDVEVLIDGSYISFEVVGVVSSGGNLLQGIMGDIVPSFLYVPYSTLSRYSKNPNFSQIVAKLAQGANETVAANSIQRDLNQKLGTTSEIKVENLNQQKDKLNSILNMITSILSAIGGISLVVAGLSIMTVMLVTVNERTREIGIKKSIGASRRMILLEFLSESFLLSIIGSSIGTVSGMAIGFLGCLILNLPFVISGGTIAFCILFSVLIGIVFGVYPARKASLLRPVEALRYE